MATFIRSDTVVADRLVSRALEFVAWLKTLPQANVTAVESFLFPTPEPEEMLAFMQQIRALWERANMNMDQRAEATAFRDAYLAYLAVIEAEIE